MDCYKWVALTTYPSVPSDTDPARLCTHRQEIFGPCLTIVKAKTLDDAIALINRNKYGNGTAIFTQSGATARKFERSIEAGQIGINVPIVGCHRRREHMPGRLSETRST